MRFVFVFAIVAFGPSLKSFLHTFKVLDSAGGDRLRRICCAKCTGAVAAPGATFTLALIRVFDDAIATTNGSRQPTAGAIRSRWGGHPDPAHPGGCLVHVDSAPHLGTRGGFGAENSLHEKERIR